MFRCIISFHLIVNRLIRRTVNIVQLSHRLQDKTSRTQGVCPVPFFILERQLPFVGVAVMHWNIYTPLIAADYCVQCVWKPHVVSIDLAFFFLTFYATALQLFLVLSAHTDVLLAKNLTERSKMRAGNLTCENTDSPVLFWVSISSLLIVITQLALASIALWVDHYCCAFLVAKSCDDSTFCSSTLSPLLLIILFLTESLLSSVAWYFFLMDSEPPVGPPLLMRFVLSFLSYVAYVLFRRLPMVLLPQIQKEIHLSREDIGEFRVV